ncbi:kinase non-catalytic C-lobe domain-containing protein 1 [Discoglossus pictus]
MSSSPINPVSTGLALVVADAAMEEAEDVQEYYGEEEEEEEDDDDAKEFYDFEPMPTLLEDEENVSLADILSLRDSGLTEEDSWAICLECCYSMKSIAHSTIFQTLCITPDTLAFNTNGNVCFMEQLSDDPEGSFVPPEFDLTGNTLEAHIYSLGTTLKAAVEFLIEPGSEIHFSQDLYSLLDNMQEENPVNRPDIESIISLCEEKLNCASSSMICRNISSIGRRVLSIESVSTHQDGWETLWKGKDNFDLGLKVPTNENLDVTYHPSGCLNINASQDESQMNGSKETGKKVDQPYTGQLVVIGNNIKKHTNERPKTQGDRFSECEKIEDEMSKLSIKKHRKNKHQSTVNTSEKGSSQLSPLVGKVTLKSWPSMPNCLSPINGTKDQDDPVGQQQSQPKHVLYFVNSEMNNNSLAFPMQNTNYDFPVCQAEWQSQGAQNNLVTTRGQGNLRSLCIDNEKSSEKYATTEDNIVNSIELNVNSSNMYDKHVATVAYQEDMVAISRHVNSAKQFPAISDGKETSTLSKDQQWISLKDLLINYGQPLNEDELWALCHECLYTLQTYIDYPAIRCLESVLIDHNGEVLYVAHQKEESYDEFCVPPEFDPRGEVTEKTCVYGIAAILWSAAKLNVPSNHKLTLPKKLKRFLLHMAKRNSDERPSLTDALLVCNNYLLQKGVDSKSVWARLSKLACQSMRNTKTCLEEHPPCEQTDDVSEPSSGFLPVSSNSKLLAVKGPVPIKDEHPKLPPAFTSPATYFKPIILMQNEGNYSNQNTSNCTHTERCANKEEKEIKDKHMFINDTGNCADEGKTRQLENSSLSPKLQDANKWDSFDQKEKTSPAASSISSNSSTIPASPVVNNYLLKQDPKTGNLKLVRVQLSLPENIPSVSIETEPVYPLPETVANNEINTSNLQNSEPSTVPNIAKCKEVQKKLNDDIPLANKALNHNPESPQTYQDNNDDKKTNTKCTSQECQTQRTVSSPLQKVVQLIHDEFAFDGYLENGVEDLAMGEYIFALKGLQFSTFCGAVCEKFCDLYWDDQLLENLYQVVSGNPPTSSRTNRTDAANQSLAAQNGKKVERKSRKYRRQGKMAANVIDSEEVVSSASEPPLNVEKEKEPETMRPIFALSTADTETVIADTEGDFPVDEEDMSEALVVKVTQSQDPVPIEFEENYLSRTFPDSSSYWINPDFIEENEENNEDSFAKHREHNLAMSISQAEIYQCSPGWISAFFGDQLFDSEVQHYVSILGRQKKKGPTDIEAKRLELEQQLMIETKNYRKTIKLYQSLLQKGKRNKGSDIKELIPKLKGHLEEMKSKVQFLELAKKLLQVSYAEQWALEASQLPTVAKMGRSHDLVVDPSDSSSFLLIYNEKQQTGDNTAKSLLAGTPLGLMSHLYASNAVLDGYVQQFLYTFRYFCSQEDLLHFLIDRIKNTLPRDDKESSSLDTKIYHCSLVLLQTWIEDCCHIDFHTNSDILDKMEDLAKSQIFPKDESGEYLTILLQEVSSKKYTISSPTFNCGDKREDTKSLHSLCSKFTEDNVSRKSFNWKISRGNGHSLPHLKDKQYTIVSALPRQCYPSFVDDLSFNSIKFEDTTAYSIHECTVQQIASQLTLIQEEMFQKCHPVHFLNSRALGLKDKSVNVPKSSSAESLPVDVCSQFAANCTQDKYLLYLLRFADSISNWVAAEIVTCPSTKLQTSVLTKFLLVAKLCYEQRDFATAVQILEGLENLIVRQLPAWKNVPSKVYDILEELKAVEVFLKSDSLCLMKGDRFRTLPTIPSAYLLAMHVQQLETGGFTMANGAFKWNKLRNIARVVSQVHAFQEIPYSFTPDSELQFYFRQRIAQFSEADISILAAGNNANFHHVQSEKHSRKIQDTLRRMKATFQ